MDIQTLKTQEAKRLLSKANVNSVGIGYKKVNGKPTEQKCIVVGVTKKLPSAQLSKRDVIPDNLDGISLDIIEVGYLRAQNINPQIKHRPIIPGISVGHKNVTCGTLGLIVEKDGKKVILSNNHVLADCNNAKIGDIIVQPGNYDSGTTEDKIGKLTYFIPIVFGNGQGEESNNCAIFNSVAKTVNFIAKLFNRKHRLSVISSVLKTNEVDAAIASIDVDYSLEIPQIGKIKGTKEAQLNMQVQKFGRTTGYTTGHIEQTDVTVSVAYGDAQSATFNDQIILSPMSQGGDSGSCICDMDGNAIALLFAGSDQATIASPIERVFSLMGVNLAY
jgi:hypothetical protein